MTRKTLIIGILSIVLCASIFSTMEVMLKLLALRGSIHPMQITMERFFIGGICLIPFAWASLKKKGIRIQREHLRSFALTGLLCVPLSMVFFQMAVFYGQANIMAVLFSANPIFVTFLAFFILRERIFWNNLLALLLSFLGIFSIINPFSPENNVNLLSVGLLITAALLFSLYSVFGKKLTKVYGGIPVTCGTFLFGSTQLLLLLLLGHLAPLASFYQAIGLSIFVDVPFFAGITRDILPYFLYICLINSAAGYVFHMKALETLGANMSNIIFFLKPILASVFALFLLGEALTSNILAGIFFFLLGSLAGFLPALLRARKQPEPSPALDGSQP